MTYSNSAPFSPAIQKLLTPPRIMPLGPAPANAAVYPLLKAMTPESLCQGQPVADKDMARCLLSGLWLYHDFFEESHTLSQSIDTSTGSYWHAILHRREPDYSNAKYWFRHVGHHPVFDALASRANEIGSGTAWSAAHFVDCCEAADRASAARQELYREIQMHEWHLLMAHCYHHATHDAGSL